MTEVKAYFMSDDYKAAYAAHQMLDFHFNARERFHQFWTEVLIVVLLQEVDWQTDIRHRDLAHYSMIPINGMVPGVVSNE